MKRRRSSLAVSIFRGKRWFIDPSHLRLELWPYATAKIYIDSDKFNEWYIEYHERQHVADFIDVATRFLRVSGELSSSRVACERGAEQLFKDFDLERQRLDRSRHGFFQKLMCPS